MLNCNTRLLFHYPSSFVDVVFFIIDTLCRPMGSIFLSSLFIDMKMV